MLDTPPIPQKPLKLTTTLQHITQLASNVKGFTLQLPEPMPFLAGQFVIVNVPHEGKMVKRAYSIASPPYETGHIELCIQIQEGGIASTFFDAASVGDEVPISGPHGTFHLQGPVDVDPVFLSVGTGIAPLRSMYKQLLHDGTDRQVWSILGVRYEHDILFHEESLALKEQYENFWYVPTVSRPERWTGERGYVQEKFKKFIPTWQDKDIYICGFTERVQAIATDLEAYGIPTAQIHYEDWG
jgi:ferredoxin-NADP reductase